MGLRGELFSTRIMLPNRTYFFNVKENRMGDLYLNIVESKNRDNGGFDRQSVILFADDLQEFLKGFDESLHVLEKAVREKRRGGGEPFKRDERRDEKSDRGDDDRYNRSAEKPIRFRERAGNRNGERYSRNGEKSGRGERVGRGERDRYSRTGEKSGRGERSRKSERGAKSRDNERVSKGDRRVVVKKRER